MYVVHFRSAKRPSCISLGVCRRGQPEPLGCQSHLRNKTDGDCCRSNSSPNCVVRKGGRNPAGPLREISHSLAAATCRRLCGKLRRTLLRLHQLLHPCWNTTRLVAKRVLQRRSPISDVRDPWLSL